MKLTAKFVDGKAESFTSNEGEVINYYRVTVTSEDTGVLKLKCSKNAWETLQKNYPAMGADVAFEVSIKEQEARKAGQKFNEIGIIAWD